jgi:hypothetical protein
MQAMDSGATPAVDAAVPMDAGVVDATVTRDAAAEAGAPEAGPLPVVVTITNHLGVESGVLIVFQDANGNVVATGTTNAAGQVTQLVESGSQVTAVMGSSPAPVHVDDQGIDAGATVIPPPTTVQLVTVQGVEPGDTLSLQDPSDTTVSGATVSIDALPGGGPSTAMQVYNVQVGNCGTTTISFPAQFPLSPDCEANGTFPVLVSALDESDTPIAYTWQDGNVIPADGGIAHVTMTGSWSTALSTQSITETNIPFSDLAQYVSYSEIASGVATPATGQVTDEDGGSYTAFQGHPGFPVAVQNEVSKTSPANGNALAISVFATRGPFDADAGAAFDLSTALPFITYVTLDGGFATPDADVDAAPLGQPYVGWSSDAGAIAGVSGVVVQVSWQYYSGSGVPTSTGAWTIVAAPTATSVTAPTLPPQVAGWGPNANADLRQPPLVIAIQSSLVPTYTVFRNQFATLPATHAFLVDYLSAGPIVPPLPSSGTLRFTGVTVNSD